MAKYLFQKGNQLRKGLKPHNKGALKSGIGEKFCESCGTNFKCDTRIGDVRWRKQRFCSKSCALKGNTRTVGKNTGESNPSWKGGITDLNLGVRSSYPYSQWRKHVFERDLYACVSCGASGVEIHADHIEAFSVLMKKHGIDTIQAALVCAELWDISNGRTLCVPCHKKTDTYAGRAKRILAGGNI